MAALPGRYAGVYRPQEKRTQSAGKRGGHVILIFDDQRPTDDGKAQPWTAKELAEVNTTDASTVEFRSCAHPGIALQDRMTRDCASGSGRFANSHCVLHTLQCSLSTQRDITDDDKMTNAARKGLPSSLVTGYLRLERIAAFGYLDAGTSVIGDEHRFHLIVASQPSGHLLSPTATSPT